MKKKIEELFRLAMKAQEKTSAYVSFETSNHGWGCVVIIMDDGFETGREYDGYYPMDMFYSDETSEEEYQKAKEHLIRSADTMKEAVKQVLKKEGVWK